MRVLAVGNMYPPHHFGGYELVWRAAMRHLERNGHQVRVLTTDMDTGAAEPDDPNVRRDLRWYWRDHGFPPLSRWERARLEHHNARVLRRELRDLGPDVVTWWSMGGMSLSMLERVRRARIPAVAFVHDDWLDYGREVDGWTRGRPQASGLLERLAERVVGAPAGVDLEHAARYVFVSETTRRRAREAGVDPPSTGVAHSGIDPGFIDPAPERAWDWSLLYVGRLDERKGVDTAVTALVHLPDATLTLVGGWDAGEEGRLRELADRHGVGARLRFAGQRSRDEVRAAYAEADAVVFPVRWEEPWGLVPLEAMARGRPVVATGRGGSGEYLRDGENALLFEAGDAAALAAAVERLADDPELRRRLREAGLETAGRHTEEHLNAAVLREIEAAVR
ncbi:MAG TPA: glycosyltransferase family 4 protein [Thermoleophilaceae bacterium]|jgi:glycosyltransferase involved in cell wall biosynthesis